MNFPDEREDETFSTDGPVICDICHQEYLPSGEPEPKEPDLAAIVDKVPDCPHCRALLLKRLGSGTPSDEDEAEDESGRES